MIFAQPTPRVADLVSRHDFVLDALPAESSGGLPLGNGDVGTSLWGGPGFLAMSLSENDVSVGEIILHTFSHESKVHPSIRGLQPLLGETVQPSIPSSPTGAYRGIDDTGHGTRDPRPATLLRLYDATAQVSLPDGIEVETFVAAQRSLVVLRIRSRGPVHLPAALELSRRADADPALPPSQFSCDGPFRYVQQDLPADLTCPDGFTAVMCGFIYGARSNAAVREGAVLATFEVPPSGECLILVGVATSRDDPNPTRRARTEVERALPHGYLLLQREHAVWWERFWAKSEAEIPHPLTEGFYYRNLYRSKVTNREPKVPLV